MMRNMIVAFATAAALVVACNHEEVPAKGPVTTTGAGVVSNDDAVKRLTDSYCDRDKACNNLGADKKFADEGACKRERGHDLQSALRPESCKHGIAQEKLAECLQEIKNEACGNIGDHISRSATCRTGRLCLD